MFDYKRKLLESLLDIPLLIMRCNRNYFLILNKNDILPHVRRPVSMLDISTKIFFNTATHSVFSGPYR